MMTAAWGWTREAPQRAYLPDVCRACRCTRCGAGEGGCGMTEDRGMKRSLRRLRRMADQARKEAERLGHELGPFTIEVEWHAAVAECKRCRLIAAIDLTESPYLFGRALKRKCQ